MILMQINAVCVVGFRNGCKVSGQEWSHPIALGQSTTEGTVPQHDLQLVTAQGRGHTGQQARVVQVAEKERRLNSSDSICCITNPQVGIFPSDWDTVVAGQPCCILVIISIGFSDHLMRKCCMISEHAERRRLGVKYEISIYCDAYKPDSCLLLFLVCMRKLCMALILSLYVIRVPCDVNPFTTDHPKGLFQ